MSPLFAVEGGVIVKEIRILFYFNILTLTSTVHREVEKVTPGLSNDTRPFRLSFIKKTSVCGLNGGKLCY